MAIIKSNGYKGLQGDANFCSFNKLGDRRITTTTTSRRQEPYLIIMKPAMWVDHIEDLTLTSRIRTPRASNTSVSRWPRSPPKSPMYLELQQRLDRKIFNLRLSKPRFKSPRVRTTMLYPRNDPDEPPTPRQAHHNDIVAGGMVPQKLKMS